jgi:hypothetical protein
MRKAALVKTFLQLLVCLGLSATLAAAADPALPEILPLDKIEPGMKGYGLSVFKGTAIERFNVEVLAVLKNFSAKQDVILVRCSGQNLEHSGIVAGMSGSPVYIDGKLVGAIAYGWGFSKDPIGGVQPIEQMLAGPAAVALKDGKLPAAPGGKAEPAGEKVPPPAAPADAALPAPLRSGGRVFEYARLARADEPAADPARPADDTLVLAKLATPLSCSGLSPKALAALAEELRPLGLAPLAAGAPSAAAKAKMHAAIEPGSVVNVQLIRGDMDMSAAGTVTARWGSGFLAFGHSMLAEGPSELPVATGCVHGVIPGYQRSFKLAGNLDPVGRLVSDHETGIYGVLGPAPEMAPMTVHLQVADRKETFQFELAQHPRFTPILIRMAMLGALTSRHDLPPQHTIRYDAEVRFRGLDRPLKLSNTVSGTGPVPAVNGLIMPVAAVMESPFGKAKLESLELHLTVEPRNTLAAITQIRLDRDRVAPGGNVTVQVTVKPYQREAETVAVPLTIPADCPEGRHELSVSDAVTHVRGERMESPHRFEVRDFAGLLDLAGADEPNTSIVLRLRLPETGLVVDGAELPDLPAGRAAVLQDGRRTNVSPLSDAVVVRHATPYVITGRARFFVTVDKRAE